MEWAASVGCSRLDSSLPALLFETFFCSTTSVAQLFQADREHPSVSSHSCHRTKHPAVCEGMKLYHYGGEVHTLFRLQLLLSHLIVLADEMTVQAMSVGKVLLLPLCPSMLSMQPEKLGLCLLFSILLTLQQRKHFPAFLSVYLSAGNVLHEWKHAQLSSLCPPHVSWAQHMWWHVSVKQLVQNNHCSRVFVKPKQFCKKDKCIRHVSNQTSNILLITHPLT